MGGHQGRQKLVKDEDLDLELELEEEPKRPKSPHPSASAPAPNGRRSPQTQARAAEGGSASAPAILTQRSWKEGISQRAASLRRFHWSLRTFLWLLLILLVIVVIAENWTPLRLYFFGSALELPKAIALLGAMAVGAVFSWLWQRRRERENA